MNSDGDEGVHKTGLPIQITKIVQNNCLSVALLFNIFHWFETGIDDANFSFRWMKKPA